MDARLRRLTRKCQSATTALTRTSSHDASSLHHTVQGALDDLVKDLKSVKGHFLLEGAEQPSSMSGSDTSQAAVTDDHVMEGNEEAVVNEAQNNPAGDQDDDNEDDNKDDDDEDDDTETSGSPLADPDRQAEHVFNVPGGKLCYAHDYLGEEYTDWIMRLHAVEPMQVPEGLKTIPRHWQLRGASKLLTMFDRWRGGILADEMGLGKTLTAIMVSESLDKQKFPGFTLVVTTKSCVHQWADELEQNFKPEHRPKVWILDDSKTTANELLEEAPDYVICTYQFIQKRYSELQKYCEAFKNLEPHTVEAAKKSTKFAAGEKWMHRFSTALHTDLYRDVGRPIKLIMLDEVQLIKNEHRATAKALHAIDAVYRLPISGTILVNRWLDAFGSLSCLRNHPFDTRKKFSRAFADGADGRSIADPSPTKENRFVKLLLGMVVCRPRSLLELPPITISDKYFWILERDVQELALYYTQKFLEAMKGANLPDARVTGAKREALNNATKAQQVVGNPRMLKDKDLDPIESMKAHGRKLFDRFCELFSDHNPSSKRFYMAIMDFLDRKVKPADVKRKLEDPTDEANKRIKTENPYLAPKIEGRSPGVDDAPGPSSNAVGSQKIEDRDDVLMLDYEDDNDDKVIGPIDGELPDEEYDPAGGAGGAENDDGDGPRPLELEEAVMSKDERKIWLAQVQGMTPEEVRSPRIEAHLTQLREILRDHPKEKVLSFSKFLKFQDLLERAIELEFPGGEWAVYRFDGSVKERLRISRIRSFGEHKGAAIMLITAGSGGAGLNLTAASLVIISEPWWRQADVEQAEARAYRLGQERPVFVYKFMGADAFIDEILLRMVQRKTMVSDRIMAKLRRTDDEKPTIPKQYPGAIGER